jgi:aryl-alcohol dehydrogenase-like predicted oxidoreductase
MDTRRLGRTGHDSSVMIFGGYAFSSCTQAESDAMMDRLIARGVNHLDIAPSYGQAEARLGPWLAHHRDEVFLGCKTMERSKDGAWAELKRSLDGLHARYFDLYQFHAVTSYEELDAVFAPGGALEAVLEARDQGLVKAIGITGHGYLAPAVHAQALERFDFDTVMTPLNFVQYADATFRENFGKLMALAQARNVGVMVIKAVTKSPWGDRPPAYNTWYEPFDTPESVDTAVRFALSQPVTGFCSPGDLRLLPLALDAADRFQPMSVDEQAALVASAGAYRPLFEPV